MPQPNKSPRDTRPNLALEIAALRNLTVGELQERYAQVCGTESRSFNRDYLYKRIAWRIQELREGGLTRETKALAAELAKETSFRTRMPRGVAESLRVHPRDPRLPPPGAKLCREHNGEAHEVTVLVDGFVYRGERYRSLSRIARTITGTNWNGLVWFGLAIRKRGAR